MTKVTQVKLDIVQDRIVLLAILCPSCKYFISENFQKLYGNCCLWVGGEHHPCEGLNSHHISQCWSFSLLSFDFYSLHILQVFYLWKFRFLCISRRYRVKKGVIGLSLLFTGVIGLNIRPFILGVLCKTAIRFHNIACVDVDSRASIVIIMAMSRPSLLPCETEVDHGHVQTLPAALWDRSLWFSHKLSLQPPYRHGGYSLLTGVEGYSLLTGVG